MATINDRLSVTEKQSTTFERFAAYSAFAAAICGLLYAIAFLILHNTLLSPLFLMLGGLFSTVVLTAVYRRVAASDATFALWGFLLATVGALGALIHGGYDLASTLHPSTIDGALASVPSSIDPRGLLTFGITGIGIFMLSWLLGRSGFPRTLSYLGYVLAALLVLLYIARLVILAPTNPLVALPALLTGFLLNPLWYLWLGISLLKSRHIE